MKAQSLKNNYEFRRLYSKGRTMATPLLAVYCRKNKRPYNQLGITVGKKIGKAVYRNKVRRRLKEIYRLNEDKFEVGYDIVVVARVKSRFASYSQLEQDFLRLFKRVSLLREENE